LINNLLDALSLHCRESIQNKVKNDVSAPMIECAQEQSQFKILEKSFQSFNAFLTGVS
jgi:hypothetical protein